MSKAESSAKNTTRRAGRKPKKHNGQSAPTKKVVQSSPEANILNMWETQNVYKMQEDISDLPNYVIREMPTPVYTLSVDTLRRKIYQDIFLKNELMHGRTVVYTPLWETFPFNIEAAVIKEDTSSTSKNIINFRKQCRQLYGAHLKKQQKTLQKLGIFADWTSVEKTMEARYETKLFSYFDKLRDAKFLRDELKLSHWCPKCITPLEAGKTVLTVSNSVLDTYVKFPFNNGFEEFGTDVYLAVRFPLSQLWEVAGTNAIGLYEKVPFWLTQFQDQYLIFAEPQLKKFINPNAKYKKYPEPIAKLDPAKIKQCSVSHPLFSLTDLPFVIIPEKIFESVKDPSEKKEILSGIIPLNPAHHKLSYKLFHKMPYRTSLTETINPASNTPTPIFDESGRFTEDANVLCGLNLSNAIQYITDELESHGRIIKARKYKIKQLECQHCNGLSVSRPYRHWVFSFNTSEIIEDVIGADEYWDNYGDDIRNDLQSHVNTITDMPISSQRQWGVPLPILRCDNCNNLITDKKVLRAVRSSIRRGSEHWFRLSVEELLPADTVCENCHSKDFRKESTHIESYFANLLQTLDISDFKKPIQEAATNVTFVPQTAFLKWLGELSILSASLQLSRRAKESQPFKTLRIKEIPEDVWETEIGDEVLTKYPTDVMRLISIAPDLSQVKLEADNTKQLIDLLEKFNHKYAQLKELLYQAVQILTHLRTNNNTTPSTLLDEVDQQVYDALSENDALFVSITHLRINDVEAAYRQNNYHKVWELLFDYCENDLSFYLQSCQTEVLEQGLTSAQIVLHVIFKVILQRFAPFLPFLAEEIFSQTFHTEKSIFQYPLNQLPNISDAITIDAKEKWTSLKKAHLSRN